MADATGFGNRERMRRAFVRVSDGRHKNSDATVATTGSVRTSSLYERGENGAEAPTARHERNGSSHERSPRGIG